MKHYTCVQVLNIQLTSGSLKYALQAEISEGVKNLSIDRSLCMSICKPPPLIAPVDLCPLFFSSVFTPTCSHSPVLPFPSFISHLPVELQRDRVQGVEDIRRVKLLPNWFLWTKKSVKHLSFLQLITCFESNLFHFTFSLWILVEKK